MIKRNLILALLSALLLSLPWFTPFSGLILLVAWLPLLLLEDGFSQRGDKGCWKYYALTFVLWNAVTTYWIYHATLFGAVGAVVGNSLQMFLIFALFRWVKRRTGKGTGYTFLVALWLAWEYFYFDAEISWPWLVLGNGFAKDVHLIQWIEYTGVLGLSLWVWLVNLSLLKGVKFLTRLPFSLFAVTRRQLVIYSILFVGLVVGPVVISLVRFYTYTEKENPCNIVVVQPNIDPYHEKFDAMPAWQQLDILLELAQSVADSSTQYVVAPETAIGGVTENTIRSNWAVQRLGEFVAQYPAMSVITGISSFHIYYDTVRPNYTAHRIEYGYYDDFNTAMQVNGEEEVQLYHKSKLVIGVEKLPYPKYFKFLEDWSIDLGGMVGSYGTDTVRHVFTTSGSPFRIGVAICYESIYGRFYTEYIKNGANLMFIITNDGWWGNSPGYRQHLSYASLRAIETRRSIARSANTGVSAFVNQRGEITASTEWWVPAALKANLNPNDKITFYVIYGDYIGRLACLVLFLLLLYAFVHRKS
jgi:apolipoprotein N-acyltransferase